MRKSGLHKQIASIFDGVPAPKAEPGRTEATCVPAAEPKMTGSETVTEAPVSPAAAVLPTARPMPVPRTRTHLPARPQGPSLTEQLSKAIFGKSGPDPRQKKMTVLVGGLAAVFAVVLFISLGGVGQGAKVTRSKASNADKLNEPKNAKAITWTVPQPLPETLRDPMRPDAAQLSAASDQTVPMSSDLVVKGIVFSQNKPSALINNEILKEGQVYQGVTIVRIDRTEVEFEANGKRWTQPVQR